MNVVSRTRWGLMRLMMITISTIMIVALVIVYFVICNTQEINNRKRLTSNEEITIGSGTVSIGETDSDGYVVDRKLPDIGSNFSMLVDSKGNVLTESFSGKNCLDSTVQNVARIAMNGKNYSKIKLNDRMWQYAKFSAEKNIDIKGIPLITKPKKIYFIRFIDISETSQILNTLRVTLVSIALLLFILFFFFCLYFSKRAIQPLIELLDSQKQFVADASHELKTPISIIKANCEVLSVNENDTIATQKEWVENIGIGANRMTALVEDLISLVKIENPEIDSIRVETDIVNTIEEELINFELLLQSKSIEVVTNYEDPSIIHSNPNYIRQIINIILDNAIKYSNDGGQISIDVIGNKRWTYLSVTNTGEGIPEEYHTKIFNRFFRVERARTQDGSHGLGLSIAKNIVLKLKGDIFVDSIVGESTTFTIKLSKFMA